MRSGVSSDLSMSFSMAKSITALLVSLLIEDGLIESIKDPVTKYLPEFQSRGFHKVKIKHLLQKRKLWHPMGMEYGGSGL